MLGVEAQPDINHALTISRSAPFRHLQSRIGSSTYRLNTVLVGLNHIATGGGEEGAVAVSWTKPPPNKAEQVADQARIFACASALVLGADVFDVFLREFAREDWLEFSIDTRDIATKARTRPKDSGGDYSVAERAAALCADLRLQDPAEIRVKFPVKIAALDLLAKWRNVIAHSSEQSIRLTAETRKTLMDAGGEIYDGYSHLDIALALKNFEHRKVPVSKEVTSLIAISVNFSRQLDEAAIKRSAPTMEKMVVAAEQMLCGYFGASRGSSISSWSELSDAWQGGAARRRNLLTKFLASAGINENDKPISAALPERFLDEIVALSRDEFAHRFKIAQDRS